MATQTVTTSSGLAGAAACLAMLQQIQRLPIVKLPPRDDLAPDDGKRLDYAAADQLLGDALNVHGSNPGFRQALANFLLGEFHFGSTNIAKFSAEELLTHGGYRPRTSGDEAAPEALTLRDMPADALQRLCVSAAAEIEALGRMLRREQDEEGFESVLNGSLIRIDALTSVLISVGSNDDGREWAEMHEVVFGEPLEVTHA